MPLNDPLLPDAAAPRTDARPRLVDRKGRSLMAQTRGMALLYVILGTIQVLVASAGLLRGGRWQLIQLAAGLFWLFAALQWFVVRRRRHRAEKFLSR